MKILDKSINFVSAEKNKSIHTCIHFYIFTPNFLGKTYPSPGTFSLTQRAFIKYLQVCFVFKLVIFF